MSKKKTNRCRLQSRRTLPYALWGLQLWTQMLNTAELSSGRIPKLFQHTCIQIIHVTIKTKKGLLCRSSICLFNASLSSMFIRQCFRHHTATTAAAYDVCAYVNSSGPIRKRGFDDFRRRDWQAIRQSTILNSNFSRLFFDWSISVKSNKQKWI